MRLFKKKLGQDEKLLKNIELYEQKEKAKQQESKILVKRKARRTKNKKESADVYSL